MVCYRTFAGRLSDQGNNSSFFIVLRTILQSEANNIEYRRGYRTSVTPITGRADKITLLTV